MGTQARPQPSESDVSLDETGAGPDEDGDGEVDLSHQETFELLSSRRRRFALHYLLNANGEAIDLNELTDRIAAWETDQDSEAVDYETRKSVRNSLHQYHLPKLDEKDLVEYDSRRGTVVVNAADEINADVYMEVVSGRDVPWGEYFLGLGAGSLAVFVGVWTGVLGFLPPVSWLAFVVAAVLLSSIGFAVDAKRSMRLGDDGPPPELKQR